MSFFVCLKKGVCRGVRGAEGKRVNEAKSGSGIKCEGRTVLWRTYDVSGFQLVDYMTHAGRAGGH